MLFFSSRRRHTRWTGDWSSDVCSSDLRWPFFKIPEHVTFFDRKTLQKLLEASGLTDVQELPYRSAFSFHLIGEKLHVRMPAGLKDRQLWLPATTIAAAGRKPR